MQDTASPPASTQPPGVVPPVALPGAGADAVPAPPTAPALPPTRSAAPPAPWTPSAPAAQAVATTAAPGGLLRRLWAARGLWLGLAAWGVALAGLLLVGDETTRPAGASLVLLAMGLAVLAWGGVRPLPAFDLRPRVGPLVRVDIERGVRLMLIALAALLVWRANIQFLTIADGAFGSAGWFWLLSMGVLLAATIAWPGRAAARPNPPAPFPGREGGDALPSPRRGGAGGGVTRAEAAVFVGLVLLAGVLRVWDLQDIPFAIHGDEILTGRTAIQGYLGPAPSPIFITLWDNINLPALWFAGVAASLKLGGGTLAALRLPAALFGAATVIPFYGLVRAAWGRRAAIAGTFILAVSAADVHYSRITLNNIVTPFFWTVCFFFLLRGLRGKRPVDWVLAGLAAGLGEYGYYGTHLLPFILAAFAAYLLLVHWRQGRQMLAHLGLLALGYLAGFGPLLAYYTRNPQLYFGRGQGVLTWDHIPRDWADLQLMWHTLWPLMAENLLGISTHPDQSTVYWAPLLFPAEAALLVLGTALLLWRWRHPPAFLLLLSGLGVLFVGGTLVHGAPFLAHWTPAFPSFYAAIAVPFGVLDLGLRGRAARPARPPRLPTRRLRLVTPQAGLRVALAAGLLALGAVNVDFYFNRYQAPRPEFEVRAVQDRWEASLGPDYQVRMVGRTWQPYDSEGMGFLVAGQDGATLYNPAAELPVPLQAGKGLAFVFADDNVQYKAAVEALYPGATRGHLLSHGGEHLFYTEVVPPTQAAAFYGALLDLTGRDGNTFHWTGKVPRIGAFPPGALGLLHAQWSSALYIPAYTSYRIAVVGWPARLLLDGQPAPLPLTQALLPGWHRLVVTSDVPGPAPLQLRLGAAADVVGAEVPTTALWPTPPAAGLLGAVRAADGTIRARIDPFIGFSAASEPIVPGPGQQAQAPLQARWVGGLQAPRAGTYTLEVRSDGAATLSVDGTPLLAACATGDPVSAPATVTLTAGWHPLQLDYVGRPGRMILELYWVPPGGTRDLVPPAALSYSADPAALPTVRLPAPPTPGDCGLPAP